MNKVHHSGHDLRRIGSPEEVVAAQFKPISRAERLEIAAYAMVHVLKGEDSPPHIHEAWAELDAALTAIRLNASIDRIKDQSHGG